MLKTLLKNYFLTKYRSFISRCDLERWQNRRTIKHLKWVMDHSPFYQELYKDLKLENWRSFPVISKSEMMMHFDTLNTCGISREEAYEIAIGFEEKKLDHSSIGDITIGLSTGTSGNRGLFLVSPEERFSWAGAMLAKMLPNGLFKRQKIAFFFRTTSPLYTSLKSKMIQLQYYHLQNPLNEHIQQLNKQFPTMLVAPPSMLRKLAEEVQSGNLLINPKKIISIAEVLDPIDQRFISSVFKQDIHQIYQATEGFLATTCQYGTLHMNEDILVIQKERIPESPSKFYPIITDFSRFSQPIIRYKLNDILHECERQCPCGSVFTAIEFIEGRSDDIFYFQSESGLKPIFPDFIRQAIISTDSSIEAYFVTQISLTKVKISLKVSSGKDADIQEKVRNKLLDFIQKQNVILPEISFGKFEEHQTHKKLRRIERTFCHESIF